jgi:hypothetical protein
MSPHAPHRFKLFVFFVVLIILEGCSSDPGVWKNEQINGNVRADFHARINELITYVKLNQIKRVKGVLSRELNSDNYTETLVEHLSNRFKDDNYQLWEEFYLVNKYIDADTVKSGGKGISKYNLVFGQPAPEMYISFFLPKKSQNSYLISIIWSKLNYGWRVTGLSAEPYTRNGYTGPELYNLAKDAYNKGHLIDALLKAQLAGTCMNPIPEWQYPDTDSLSDFTGRLIGLANEKYKFPFVLNQVPTKPKIFRVFNRDNDEGWFPMVHYLSSIKLKDEVAIRRENAQVRKIIGTVMPGIDQDKKYVQYSAFNQLPSVKREVYRVEMTDTLK